MRSTSMGTTATDKTKTKMSISGVNSTLKFRKLNREDVSNIRKMHKIYHLKAREIFNKFKHKNVSLSLINSIIYNRSWKHVE